MALLSIDGFGHYLPIHNTPIKGWTIIYDYSNGKNSSIVTGRFNTGSALWALTSNYWGITLLKSFQRSQTIFLGFAWKHKGINMSLTFYDSGASQCKVVLDSTGKIYFQNGAGTVTYTDTLPNTYRATLNAWIYIEIKVTIADSISSDSCVIKVNESIISNLASGQDTKATANSNIDSFGFMLSSAGGGDTGFYITDVYICDTTGSVNNTFLGDARAITLFPTGNGNYSQFVGSDSNSTDNYLLVDETTPNTTDYVQSDVDKIDSYSFENMAINPKTIFGVQLSNYATKTDVGTIKVSPLIRLGGTDYLATESTLTAEWIINSSVVELNPADSAAWEKADVDAAEFGFKITA
jgi:hypothetical protein